MTDESLYVLGYVAQTLLRTSHCHVCKAFLTGEKQPERYVHQLIQMRDYGGLVYPSMGLCKLLAYAETIIRSYMSVHQANSRFSPLFLKIAVMTRCNTCQLLGMEVHAMETQVGVSNHHEQLVSAIVNIFYRLRMKQITTVHNQDMHEHSVRQRNTHHTNFSGQ